MIILKDLLYVLGDVMELEVRAYSDFRLLHEWIFGEDIEETVHQWHDRKRGILSIIDAKINAHGDIKRNGVSEMGFGAKFDAIPREILEAEVTHILLSRRINDGRELSVYVSMDALAVETAKAVLTGKERQLWYGEEK